MPPRRERAIGVCRLNFAVTDEAALTVIWQTLLPVQAPDHPAKSEPKLGVAVSVTMVPAAIGAVQSTPQLTPPGFEVTTPLPEPTCVTDSVMSAANENENMPRPYVAAIKVLLSYQNSSRTRTLAGPSLLVLQVTPPFSEV